TPRKSPRRPVPTRMLTAAGLPLTALTAPESDARLVVPDSPPPPSGVAPPEPVTEPPPGSDAAAVPDVDPLPTPPEGKDKAAAPPTSLASGIAGLRSSQRAR